MPTVYLQLPTKILLFSELSAALKASLLHLAQAADCIRIQAEIQDEIQELSQDASPLPVLTYTTVSLEDWETGVEQWHNQAPSVVYRLLGIKEDEALANFNQFIDPINAADPWINSSWQDPNQSHPDRTSLRPHWHQLVGILKMLNDIWQGKPIMLMDGVGLGKTLQVVGVMALLVYYRAVKAQTGDYPGIFSMLHIATFISALTIDFIEERKFQGLDEIPDRPMLLVVPLPLRAQVEVELHRYLKHGRIDILLYDGGINRVPEYWDKVYNASSLPEHKRLVLATTTVC